MPIVREYSPSAALVGQAAYQAGLGEHQRYQDQLGLQTRQLDQQRDLSLFGAGMQQQSQHLDIAAQMQQQANALAGNQWQTMAGVAGQSYLNQQQNQFNMASQVYGAGVGAAMQTQQLQTNSLLQFQQQWHQNDQLIKQLQQQAAGQQFAAAADLGMQTQRLATGLVQQQVGIGADTAQQNRGIVASAMQQQEGIAASDRQQAVGIAADRQNVVDQLASQDWRTQFGAAIDQQNLSAQLQNQQYLQDQELKAAQQRQQASIDASFKQQINDIQAKKDIQYQAQQVQAIFQNQDVALQQQQLVTQLEARKEEAMFNAWAQQQSQMAQQMANERMSVWEQGNANYRQGMQIQGSLAENYQNRQFSVRQLQDTQAFDARMQQQRLDTANKNTSQEMQYRKDQQLFQLQDQAMKVSQAVSSGMLRAEEGSMLLENLYAQMGQAQDAVPEFQKPDLTQQWQANQVPLNSDGTSFVYRQPNGSWEVYDPKPQQDNSVFQYKQQQDAQKFQWEQRQSILDRADKLMAPDPVTGQPRFSTPEQAQQEAARQLGLAAPPPQMQVQEQRFSEILQRTNNNPQVQQAIQTIKGVQQRYPDIKQAPRYEMDQYLKAVSALKVAM